jgi:hypothetical protein
MSNWRAISSTQSHAEATQRSSEVIRGTQRHSEALKGTQRHSDAIRRNQTQSDAIRRNHRHSAALCGTQRHLRGHRDPRWPRGPRLPGPSLVARRRRLLRHRRAHLPVPFAADDPRSAAALFLRVPAPQNGETPADIAAKYNGNAEVKAFFASGQVRPICVQSEVIRGHSEGTQWQSRGRRDPRRPRWPHRVLSVRRAPCACARVRSTCRRRHLPRHLKPHVSSDGETASKRLLLGRATLCRKASR